MRVVILLMRAKYGGSQSLQGRNADSGSPSSHKYQTDFEPLIQQFFDMNLAHEEKILIKDIFNVRVCEEPGDSESLILLKNFPREIGILGPNVSLIKNTTYFDSLLMERLQLPNTDVLGYLEECMNKCFYVVEKPWNQTPLAQEFIKYSIEIIKNFIYLSQLEVEIFPDQIIIDEEAGKMPDATIAVAMRVMTHFQRRGFNMEILNIFYPRINDEIGGDFAEAFIEVLIARQRFQTILDSRAFFYLTVLDSLMTIPEFKATFLKLPKTPFLPVELAQVQGSMIDTRSPLGIFLRPSILGSTPGFFHQELEATKRYEQKVIKELGRDKFGKDRVKYYTDLQNEFYSKFTDIYKVFLRKDSQKKFLEWNYAVVLGNLSKAKLGSRLHNAQNKNLSHDGFLINVYMCLVNLCKPIFNLQTEKYRNIDPEYFMCNSRTAACKYEKINKKEVEMHEHKDKSFGTITEFFFLAWELLYVGVIPAHQTFVEDMNAKEKLEEMLKKTPGNHPRMQMLVREVERYRTKTVLSYLVLMDENIIHPTIKLFDLLMYMLPIWLKFDYEELVDCKFVRPYKAPEIQYYLPEHLLDSIEKFHIGTYRYKQNYLQMLGENHVHELLKLTCLILSEEAIVSNPYIGASYVELIFFLLYESKSGIMYDVFKSNVVAHRNLTLALMRFYCDIAVTGSSHQFYSKFRYRQCVNKILMSLWVHEVYRENLKSYFKSEVFEKFLNMIMGDTTYCFDETNDKYEKFKELEQKSQQGKLSEEDQRNEEQLASQIHATLQQSASNLKLIKELSKWSPETFFSEAFLNDIVLLLNNILATFMDPTSFISNRQLLLKFKFDKEMVLSHLVQSYVNLDISERFASEIVKDARFFRKEHFYKALQRASNEHQTDIITLEKFEELIGKLINPVNDEEDEEIYGEIPDKYLCNLMSTLMKQPVELPSGYVVDRVYIHKHLLNDERDPFTRAPMKNGDWKELKELKQEIEVWKKKRLEELKGANKEIKYGKIGQNKKEEEEESLYGDKVIKYEDEEAES